MPHKSLLALALFCVWSITALSEDMSPTVQSIISRDTWAVADGSHGGKPLIIRFRDEFRTKPEIRAYPKLIKVSWSYDGGKSGLPDTKTNGAMAVFEDRLMSAVEPDVAAVLVAVITNNNSRTWVYYASSVQVFGRRLHDMPQETKPYPIEIEADTDPEWTFLYHEILSSMKDENP